MVAMDEAEDDDFITSPDDVAEEDPDEEVNEIDDEEHEDDSCIVPQLPSRLLLPQDDGAVLLAAVAPAPPPPDSDVSEVENSDENPVDVMEDPPVDEPVPDVTYISAGYHRTSTSVPSLGMWRRLSCNPRNVIAPPGPLAMVASRIKRCCNPSITPESKKSKRRAARMYGKRET
uniref:Uncharacterized protein n=1 Tax=Anopheles coluzzii TaxID=1518534 RepID=A0A8W7P970_ANOCL